MDTSAFTDISRLRTRRGLCALPLLGLLGAGLPAAARAAPAPGQAAAPTLDRLARQARQLEPLRALLVARDGAALVESSRPGMDLDAPVNIKSASKSLIAAMIGRAIAEGMLPGVHAAIAPLLKKRLPARANPRLAEITVEDLLTMRAGLERTSGPNYGRWVNSRDWVGYVVSRPFVDEPGGRMLYSTGSSHLLSAILTDASGRSTLQLARDWFGEPLAMRFGGWDRDPQGIYLGGNNMAISPRALLRFGEMMRQDGRAGDTQVVPGPYIQASWQPRTQSPFTGHAYGYGWFIAEAAGHPVYYAWGYGGQLLYVLPSLSASVVMISDPDQPSGRNGYARQLHELLAGHIVPALAAHGRQA
ncbi:serine hydrolase [Orrella sp. JC864]|uniref:serine hydrolase domain-containing protein n=1 Tax=Orrella sp. JC864 TaxID=3120298 RepID=UPI0030085A05